MTEYGPQSIFSQHLHASKYRSRGEDFRESINRQASVLSDSSEHFEALQEILLDMRFLPGGRIQAGAGSPRTVTLTNCFMSGNIEDSFVDGPGSIMERATQAAQTMRMGGGIGYNFSTLRPKGDLIKGVMSHTDGPLAFLPIFNAICQATSSAGNRRGAQMGIMRIDHPDIEEFIHAKRNSEALNGFNLSVAVTDQFMQHLETGDPFPLKFNGATYGCVNPRTLWDTLMRSAWDWSEPGVFFIDTANRMNNLYYCEETVGCNPSLRGDELVYTSLGIAKIKDLEGKTFECQGPSGEWHKSECIKTGTDKRLMRLTFSGGRHIDCTPDHKWPVERKSGTYMRVRADELEAGDFILRNRNEKLSFCNDPSYIYEDGLVAGIIFGDGWFGTRNDDGRYYLGIETQDKMIADKVATYFKANTAMRGNLYSVQVCKSEIVKGFLDKVQIIDKIDIPKTVWDKSSDFTHGFIDGYFGTDGCFQDMQFTLTCKSEQPLRSMQRLLGFMGVDSGLSGGQVEQPSFPNGKKYDRVYFRYNLRGKRASFDNVISPFRSNVPAAKVLSRTNRLDIKSIEYLDDTADTWDIRMFGDEHVFPTSYCATGNCGEQPLPQFGACLLGSFNLVKYISEYSGQYYFNHDRFIDDIPVIVRAMDKVTDISKYPLEEQRVEALSKRRMGLGITALANTLETIGFQYGDFDFLRAQSEIMSILRDVSYEASSDLAEEKGAFPLFKEDYLEGQFIKTLPNHLQEKIANQGIRNSHLLSVAPTGTISLTADNVSSGIEPVISHSLSRKVKLPEGEVEVELEDYAYRVFGTRGKLASQVTAQEHIDVLATASYYVDSAVSKTCNVNGSIPWTDFKQLFIDAWKSGCKGCTVFNEDGKRAGIFKKTNEKEACYIDQETGRKECS